MQTLKLLSSFLKVNIQMSLAYRTDTVVNILLKHHVARLGTTQPQDHLQQHYTPLAVGDLVS